MRIVRVEPTQGAKERTSVWNSRRSWQTWLHSTATWDLTVSSRSVNGARVFLAAAEDGSGEAAGSRAVEEAQAEAEAAKAEAKEAVAAAKAMAKAVEAAKAEAKAAKAEAKEAVGAAEAMAKALTSARAEAEAAKKGEAAAEAGPTVLE